VTAVCSTRNVDLMRALGADHVVDYSREDFVAGGARFDVMLDLVGNRSISDCTSVLEPKGAYVACGGGSSALRWLFRTAVVFFSSLFTDRKLTNFAGLPTGRISCS
jgi:NADPH:quinone reductase-like Zn-dependent oxidoreductase